MKPQADTLSLVISNRRAFRGVLTYIPELVLRRLIMILSMLIAILTRSDPPVPVAQINKLGVYGYFQRRLVNKASLEAIICLTSTVCEPTAEASSRVN